MNPAEFSSCSIDENNPPLVRIDAQEEIFVLPLREYLESNGCIVADNTVTDIFLTYHIVAGGADFVKDIFSTRFPGTIRRLGIIVGSSHFDSQKLTADKTKIIVVDPVNLTEKDVKDFFSFFFSENALLLDKRRSSHEPVLTETKVSKRYEKNSEFTNEIIQVNQIPHTEQGKEDVKRISDLVAMEYKTKSIHKKRHPSKNIFTSIITMLVIIILPVFWYAISLSGSGFFYGLAAKELSMGNFSMTDKYDSFGDQWLTHSKISFALIKTPMIIVGLDEFVRNQERLVFFMEDISALFEQMNVIIENGRKVATILLSVDKEKLHDSPVASLSRLHVSTSHLIASYGLTQAQLEMMLINKVFPFSLSWMYELGQYVSHNIEIARNALMTLDHLLVMYPRIAGFDKPVTYLILLQNSNELRPTGGFIGSIGKIVFDKGLMRDFTIQDVYTVDGQLRGHVDPPEPIRELLGQEHWYLRDSNWDPDFRVSGEKAAWFYQKETGEIIDGVIAVSIPFVADLLHVTGPITLSDYNDRITQENFFGKSIFYTQSNFFPGSTQKSDFLGSLSRSILELLISKGADQPLLLFQAISNGLNRKDLMFYFNDPELEKLSVQYHWAGGLFARTGCNGIRDDSCMSDALGIFDANLSVSKVNYFIKRSSVRELMLDFDGSLSETVALSMQNTAVDNTPGVGGSYLSYQRFYIPTDVSIVDVTLNDVPMILRDITKQGVPAFPYFERTPAESGFQVIAVVTQVPPGSKQTTKLHYKHNRMFNMNNKQMILDVLQDKQGGVSGVEQSLRIHVPASWDAIGLINANQMSEPILAKNGQLEYNTTLSRDQLIRVIFSQ